MNNLLKKAILTLGLVTLMSSNFVGLSNFTNLVDPIYALESSETLIISYKINSIIQGTQPVSFSSPVVSRAYAFKVVASALEPLIAKACNEGSIRGGSDFEYFSFIPPSFSQGKFNITAFDGIHPTSKDEMYRIKVYSSSKPYEAKEITINNGYEVSVDTNDSTSDLILEFYELDSDTPFERYYLDKSSQNQNFGIALGVNNKIHYLRKKSPDEGPYKYNATFLENYFNKIPMWIADRPYYYNQLPEEYKPMGIRQTIDIGKSAMSKDLTANDEISELLNAWKYEVDVPGLYSFLVEIKETTSYEKTHSDMLSKSVREQQKYVSDLIQLLSKSIEKKKSLIEDGADDKYIEELDEEIKGIFYPMRNTYDNLLLKVYPVLTESVDFSELRNNIKDLNKIVDEYKEICPYLDNNQDIKMMNDLKDKKL